MRGKRTPEEISKERINKFIETNWQIINFCNSRIKEFLEKNHIQNFEEFTVVKKIKQSSLEMLNDICWEDTRAIKPRLRFSILKRDNFTCQYCWMKAPNVILHVDHVIPFSKWWKTSEDNLKTSCQDCNLWKSNIH